jgi:hypothetical protein
MVLLDSSHPGQWTSTPEGEAQYKSFSGIYRVSPALARIGVVRVLALFQPDSGLPSPQKEEFKAFFAATKDSDAQSAEFLASPGTNVQVRESGPLGNKPLFVLSATNHGTPPDQEKLWQNWQNELADLSTNSMHQVVDGAEHDTFWRNPEISKVSVAVILDVVEAVRTGTALEH